MVYKIVTKATRNRLKKIMPIVISHIQGAFVKRRSITDNILHSNILLSSEVLHYLKRKTQGKHGYATLKVDMAMAYDRVE